MQEGQSQAGASWYLVATRTNAGITLRWTSCISGLFLVALVATQGYRRFQLMLGMCAFEDMYSGSLLSNAIFHGMTTRSSVPGHAASVVAFMLRLLLSLPSGSTRRASIRRTLQHLSNAMVLTGAWELQVMTRRADETPRRLLRMGRISSWTH